MYIKVDREERPDLDQIYMNAVQLLTGRGGWPMSVFLTPDLKPFYGGTYWPPHARMGMPGFDQVLRPWPMPGRTAATQAIEQAEELTAQLQSDRRIAADRRRELSASADRPRRRGARAQSFDLASRRLRRGAEVSASDGPAAAVARCGSGTASDGPAATWSRSRSTRWPPAASTISSAAAFIATRSTSAGSCRTSRRCSTTTRCLPICYVEALSSDRQRRVRPAWRARRCDYVLREMTDPAGGFYSTQDADSEGEEGKFYVWTPAEVEAVLGAEAAEFCYVYDVSDAGNFEGHNILNLPKSIDACAKIRQVEPNELRTRLASAREKLLGVRGRRVRPGRDDKVLVSWNGLMIDALAGAAGALDEPRYLQASIKAADFMLREMRQADGTLLHSWRDGRAKHAAYLDDYASLANALVSLYEATFDEQYIDTALQLVETMLTRFADAAGGGFFFTADNHEPLIARHKDIQDSSVPSGNALVAMALVRLGKLTGKTGLLDAAEKTLRLAGGLMERAPTASGQMLLALEMFLGPTSEIVVLGNGDSADTSAVLRELRRRFNPNKVIAARLNDKTTSTHRSSAMDLLFAGKDSQANKIVLYVCENFACQAPGIGKQSAIAQIKLIAERP